MLRGVRLRESWGHPPNRGGGIPLFRTLRSGATLPPYFLFFFILNPDFIFYFPVLRCNFVSDVFSLVLRVVIRVVVF